jgi:putative tryptophan/tyrosine transport system substrate-binding protein
MNNRRKFVVALGAGVLTAPFGSFAQQKSKVWRIGILSSRSRPASLDSLPEVAFLRGMRELGYVEGKNLTIEWRFIENNDASIPRYVSELVNLKPDAIVSSYTPITSALQKKTTTIPIVFANLGDPVGNGLVKSLAHPGGNITGLTSINPDLAPKWLEMLLAMAPRLSRVAMLVNPSNASNIRILEAVQAAGLKRGLRIARIEVRAPQEIGSAFSLMTRDKAQAFVMPSGPVFGSQYRQIADLALQHRLPSVHPSPDYVEAGGLISYGVSLADQLRRAATYVDKILKGAKPADLPVEQPTKFELVINGKTAKALGLKIPQSLLISADKVIE